jgi:hypothetical protein
MQRERRERNSRLVTPILAAFFQKILVVLATLATHLHYEVFTPLNPGDPISETAQANMAGFCVPATEPQKAS